jgi:nitrite reductase (NADH) large subunit
LQERGKQSRRIVIVGGGLLALETAQALQQQIDGIKTSAKGKPGMKAAEIILVQHASRLMNEQLDEHAANLLLEKTKDMGLEVYLNCGVGDITARENGISEQAINEQAINERTFSETSVLQDKEEIETHTAVHCVRLRNGVEIPCDTVVLCTGVVPNIALAKACNLRIRRGIAVNDCMQTSDLDIYAIGECAEYNKQVYGFVEPGYQQAEIAASHIAKEKKSHLNKQINNSLLPLTQLKLTDYPVFSIGLVDQELSAAKLTSLCWEDTQSGTYRRLFLRRGKVVGALAVKPWPELSKLQEAIEHHARIGLLAKRRFAKTGQVYGPLFNLESFFKTTSPPDNTATTTADLTASHQDKTQTDT